MACSNGRLSRYVVQFSRGSCVPATMPPELATLFPADGSRVTVPSITKVTGVGLGEEGEVEVPEWDRNGLVSDGKRKLKAISMSMRTDGTIGAALATGVASSDIERMAAWFKHRGTVKGHAWVWITDASFTVMYGFKCVDLTMRKFDSPDRDLGQPKLDEIELLFSPYDVELVACDGTTTIISSPSPTASLTFCP